MIHVLANAGCAQRFRRNFAHLICLYDYYYPVLFLSKLADCILCGVNK